MLHVEKMGGFQLSINVVVRSLYPKANFSTNFKVSLKMPASTTAVTFASNIPIDGRKRTSMFEQAKKNIDKIKDDLIQEWDNINREIHWSVNKYIGETEKTFNATAVMNAPADEAKNDVGPLNITFEVSMWNASGLQVKHIRPQFDEKNFYKWVR